MTRILCVEDDPALLKALGANLRVRGYEVELAPNGREALDRAPHWRPDLFVLDLGLPDMSGIQVIHGLRQWTSAPILVLSARDTEFDKVGALDAGADDYVTKPFGVGELLARIRAALRRRTDSDDRPVVTTADFVIDLAQHIVQSPTGDVHLTPTEWSLVEYLVRNPDRLVSSREILRSIWGPQYGTETNYLRVHMTHIRRKLEPEPARPRYFRTEQGMGYRFTPGTDR